MAKVLKCGKRDWLEAFSLNVKTEDSKAAIYEEAGDEDNPAHMTLFRETWKYTFQPYHGVAEIMDRIFSSGPRAAHITLETGIEPEPRVYRGGPSYGDPVTNPLMEGFLKTRMDEAARLIEQRCNDWDRFDWVDGEHDLDKLIGHPDDGFLQMAMIASKRNNAEVIYPTQKDAALLMKAVSIHPLQPLQNTFQRIVRDACRGITDEEKRKEKESEQMANYFFVESVPPKPLAPPKDAEPDTQELLDQVEKKLAKLQKAMKNAAAGDAAAVKELKPRATEILASLKKVRSLYANGKVYVPTLEQTDRALDGVKNEINKARADRDYDVIHKRLTQAHEELSKAFESYCCIQNFHIIEPFYLFRLLVKFRITSDQEIPASTVTKVSSTVTGLLHNNSECKTGWLFDWLRDKLVELTGLLEKNCGKDKVVFFLKGGRAAKYLQKIEREGENDWDTQIVINPNLRASQWYETFAVVHNTVLSFLQQARAEFLTVASKNAASLQKGLAAEFDKDIDDERKAKEKQDQDNEELATGKAISEMFDEDEDDDDEEDELLLGAFFDLFRHEDDDDELAPDKFKKNCKAELIDVGIPRRDTPEAFEQWAHVRPHLITCPDKIVIPGHLYYINEYVMMIRDAFADNSISMPKTPKRVIRLLEVLELPSLDEHIQEEEDKIPKGLLDKSLGKIAGLDKPIKHMLTILLKQYMEAWDLDIDKGLAAHFDDLFSNNVDQMAAKAKYPASLTKAIKDENEKSQKDKKKDSYVAKHIKLADAIGFAQWIASDFSDHLTKARHKFNVTPENSKKFGSFAKALYTGSFFGKGEENLEVRMAITGAAGALLHANYGQFDRKSELMPVTRMDIAIFCKDDADPATVLELVEPVIQKYLDHSKTPKYKMVKVKNVKKVVDTICLYWPEEVKIGDWSYTPLAFKIKVDPRPEDWPQASFIKGLPVLGLRDLVWDFKKLTGNTEENFTQRKRKAATEALVDLLTRFENPDAGKPWVRPGYNGPVVPKEPEHADSEEEQKEVPPEEPRVRKVVPDLVNVAQAKPNWCWAAVSAMMRNFYKKENITQNQIAVGFLTDERDAQGPLQLTGLTVGNGQGITLSWEDVKQQIDGKKPFIFASGVHYMVGIGYEEQGTDKRVVYWDPLPTGTGRSTNMTYQYYCDTIANNGATYTITA